MQSTMHRARILVLAVVAGCVLISAIGVSGATADDWYRYEVSSLKPWNSKNLYEVRTTVNGRSSPHANDVKKVDFVHAGQRVYIKCQTRGGPAPYGGNLWDRVALASNARYALYIPDRYVRTYTNGFLPKVRRC